MRKFLLDYLQAKEAEEQKSAFNPAELAMAAQTKLETIRRNAGQVFSTFGGLPGVFAEALSKLVTESGSGQFGQFVFLFLIALAVAAGAEFFVRRRLAAAGFYDLREADGLAAKLTIFGWRLLLAAGHTILFSAVAALVFFALGSEQRLFRVTFVFYLTAIAMMRMLWALIDTFLSPTVPHVRIPNYSDGEALEFRRALAIAMGFGTFGFFTCALFSVYGIHGPVHVLLLMLCGTITVGLLIWAFISCRKAIAADVLSVGSEPGRARQMFSKAWPYLASVMIALVWTGLVLATFAEVSTLPGAGVVTLLLILLAPSFDVALEREAVRCADTDREMMAAIARSSRIALAIVVFLLLSYFWDVDLTAAANTGIGTIITTSGLKIALSLMLAYLLWNATKVWIDRKIKEEELAAAAASGQDLAEQEIGGTGQSRLRTLLPLFKLTFQITIAVIAGMLVLSSLGVDIAPVLAGAGVIGLAVGFGSQTLVRDIVSGVFFLMDDAFRLGEYVDIGDVKGTVEKISLRSFQLRHHRGAVNTVPFGEIRVLKNYSRDWAIMKLRFRVSFDADLEKVRKIMKAVGRDLLEMEDIKEDFIQPFKSQGVLEVDDYGFVVRAKFMSKPGKQFLIRRHAYQAVQKAFADNGIEFAKPEVRVVVGDEDEGDDEKAVERAAGAAVQIDAAKRMQQKAQEGAAE